MEKGTSRGPLATRYGFLGSVTGDVHTLLSTTKQHCANKTKQKNTYKILPSLRLRARKPY